MALALVPPPTLNTPVTAGLDRPVVVNDVTRRQVLVGLAAAGLVAGCSTVEGGAAPPPRTVPYVGPFGPVDLPLAPQRVVTMYATDTDYALVLGLPVVGASSGQGSTASLPVYHADRLAGVTPVVSFPDPDYEAIAALKPDLLLHGSASYSPETAGPLSAIAPLFAFPETLDEQQRFRVLLAEVARVFERTDVAEEFVRAYEERAAALRERIRTRWGGATIAYIGPMDPGAFYVAQANMQTNLTLHEDLGLAHAAVVPPTVEQRRTDISYEEMGLLTDVDILLLRVNNETNSPTPDRTQTNLVTSAPLWSTLPAVRAGAVFEISGDLFYTSPLTATANLDWAERTLLPT